MPTPTSFDEGARYPEGHNDLTTKLQIWFENGVADGSNVMPPWLPRAHLRQKARSSEIERPSFELNRRDQAAASQDSTKSANARAFALTNLPVG
jgi:hypothetical protein